MLFVSGCTLYYHYSLLQSGNLDSNNNKLLQYRILKDGHPMFVQDISLGMHRFKPSTDLASLLAYTKGFIYAMALRAGI
jgi:hypothetical protein